MVGMEDQLITIRAVLSEKPKGYVVEVGKLDLFSVQQIREDLGNKYDIKEIANINEILNLDKQEDINIKRDIYTLHIMEK